jgi:COMPASS component SWD2
MVSLDPGLVQRFGVGKAFPFAERVNSLDFDASGEFVVTSSNDDYVRLYSVRTGKLTKTVTVRKHGARLVRFAHHNTTVLVASNSKGWEDAVRYLSLHDNKYLRFFKGHNDQVISMEMCPVDDRFLSGSLDQTVRYWDLRTNRCQGMIRTDGARPIVAFDPQGLVFAIGTAGCVKLYDSRKEKNREGPFVVSNLAQPGQAPKSEWSALKFSQDGKYLLLTTAEHRIYLLDAFSGQMIREFVGHGSQHAGLLEASFSVDVQFVTCGVGRGAVFVWKTETGELVVKLVAPTKDDVPQAVTWNPKKLMFGTTGLSLGFWIPNLPEGFHAEVEAHLTARPAFAPPSSTSSSVPPSGGGSWQPATSW